MANFSKEDNWVRRFTVTDPYKHQKGFTLYKITSMVYPKKYPEAVTKIVVWKRYSDFRKLHKELKECRKKLKIEDELPPFVKAKFFSRFESNVVEERRQAALNLLEFVARYPPLFTCAVFVKFFESSYVVDGSVTDTVVRRSASPLSPRSAFPPKLDPDTGQVLVSDDDYTSFTTDTDSVNSPLQGPEAEDVSMEEESWSGPAPRLKTSLSQTTLSSLASVESVFSRRLQSFKNRLLGNSADSDNGQARLKEAEMSRYWTEAQAEVDRAEVKEREGDYQQAFDCYKAAIALLLQGVQNDTDRDRRKLVKERTADYLCKAEFIANHFLSSANTSPARREPNLVPLSQLWQPMADLVHYKVVSVMDRVMLVIDTRTHYLFIIKSLRKSSFPVGNKPCVMPRRVPYMVELHAIFENECSVFLVLQYVSGGKLWDYVDPFLEKRRSEGTPARVRRGSPSPLHRPLDPHPDHLSTLSVSDSCPSLVNVHITDCEVRSTLSSPGTSYVDLLRDYSTSKRGPEDLPLPPPDLLVTSNGAPDSLPPPEITLNIQDTVDVGDIDTKELVEHAQRLLQSVDATLLQSQTVVSRVELDTEELTPSNNTSPLKQSQSLLASPFKHKLASDELKELDRLSIASNHSNKSLDVLKLMPNSKLSSKRSSLVSSVGGPDAGPQWCQLQTSGPGVSEETVRRWAAQLVVALHTLHQTGVTCLDLHADNILLCGTAIRLTYFCSFPGVEPLLSRKASKQLFTAPELLSIFPTSQTVDWWSLGVLLYHLLTGTSLSSHFPSGVKSHTMIHIPDTISVEARSLLRELLRYDPQERLGSGLLGVEEIKSHPFFEGVQWDQVYDEGLVSV